MTTLPTAGRDGGGGSGLVIRPFERRDLGAVDALERAIYPSPWRREHFERLLGTTEAEAWVAETGEGVVVGYAVGWVVADEAELANIAVAEGHRRGGVGRQLLETIEGRAALRGARRIYLEVREGNASARAFYGSHGYRPVGRRPGYYRSPREDAITMARDLGSGAGPVVAAPEDPG